MQGKKPKIRKLKGKDQNEYFEKIYRDYFDRLYAYALVIIKSDVLAKDIVSEVFFNLWSAKTDLASIKELKSYLFTSVKNQAIRTLSRNPEDFDTESYKEAVACIDWISPEELLIGKELETFLTQTIKELPPHCGLVFKMIKDDKMRYDEVAKELGISVETVKYHFKTAVKKLRAKLESHFNHARVVDLFFTGVVVIFGVVSLIDFIS